MTYVTCINSPEDNYDIHNGKDYSVIEYDTQPYGIGKVKISLDNGDIKLYDKTMFSIPFNK